MFVPFPDGDRYASSASSLADVLYQFHYSPSGFHTRHDSHSVLSILVLHHNRKWEQKDNIPNPGHNNMSGTTDFAINATTSRSRRRGLNPHTGPHRHLPHRVMASYQAEFRIHRVAALQLADQKEHHHRPVQWQEEEQHMLTPKASFQKTTFSFYCLLFP